MSTVLVVGSLHYDIMVRAPALPRRDETMTGTAWHPKFGGKGGNQAVAAALGGATVRMLGAVGRDSFGAFLRDQLRSGGVDDSFVATHPVVGSGMSVAISDAAGDYAAVIVSGANLCIAEDHLHDPALWRDVRLVVLQNEVSPALNLASARAAALRDIPVVLNAAPMRPLDDALAGLVNILVVNAVEAEMLGTPPVASLAEAALAAKSLSQSFRAVVVTAGRAGLAHAGAYAGAEGAGTVAARKVAAISSHGAGDAFTGTLAAALAAGATLPEACFAGSEAAARHVASPAGW